MPEKLLLPESIIVQILVLIFPVNILLPTIVQITVLILPMKILLPTIIIVFIFVVVN